MRFDSRVPVLALTAICLWVVAGFAAVPWLPERAPFCCVHQPSTVTTHQTVQSQLVLYQVQHDGRYPDPDTFWAQMTGRTLRDGTLVQGEAPDGVPVFGPYLQKPATNHTTGRASVATVNRAPLDDGWAYDPATGRFVAVVACGVAMDQLGNDPGFVLRIEATRPR